MKHYIPFIILFTFLSCSGKSEIAMTEENIDLFVSEILDPTEVYDIARSLRFSKDEESYTVVEYDQNDTVILINEKIEFLDKFLIRNMYYRDAKPIYIEEFEYPYYEADDFIERRIYLNGTSVMQGYKRSSNIEEELEFEKFEKITVKIEDYDFERSNLAINQEGDYEMKFGEFLIIEPQRYLILENEKSGYNVALFLMSGDLLIEQLYEIPEDYKGKTIFIHHEFMDMNGIERMIYKGGIVKE